MQKHVHSNGSIGLSGLRCWAKCQSTIRSVGAVGLVGVRLGKRWVVFGEGAVDLVGADVQKAKSGFVGLGQSGPVGSNGFQQPESADDVGPDEVFRAVDGAVHMAFGRKVQHGAGAVLGQQGIDQQGIHQGAVAEVALYEVVARVALLLWSSV
jgi:hypothetical protein